MWLYQTLDRLCPSSFTAKVFILAFVGTHVPLVAAIVFSLLTIESLEQATPMLLVLLFATLAGAIGTLAGLRALLMPIKVASKAAAAYEAGKGVPELPTEFKDEAGQLLLSVRRLTERAERRLRVAAEEASKDPLTGVLNRRGFNAMLDNLQPKERSGAVLSVDIDHFKEINDEYGHQVGDSVLKDVANAIVECVRSADPVGRFGGDEFVIFLSGATQTVAMNKARAIRSMIDTDVRVAETNVTVSIGLAITSPPEDSSESSTDEVFSASDKALYQAKSNGRNQVHLFGGPEPIIDHG